MRWIIPCGGRRAMPAPCDVPGEARGRHVDARVTLSDVVTSVYDVAVIQALRECAR